MNNQIKVVLLLVLAFLVSSCSNSASSDDRENLFGEWTILQKSVSFADGIEVATDELQFDVTFFDDGTGVKKWNFFPSEVKFEWVYQEEPNAVSIFTDGIDLGGGSVIPAKTELFDVIDIESDRQFWQGSLNDYIWLGDTLVFGTIETDWTLTPK